MFGPAPKQKLIQASDLSCSFIKLVCCLSFFIFSDAVVKKKKEMKMKIEKEQRERENSIQPSSYRIAIVNQWKERKIKIKLRR